MVTKPSTSDQWNYAFNFEALAPYEIGAALAVILACPPGVTDEEMRGRFHTVLCAQFLRAQAKADPAWANQPQLIKPLYAFYPEQTVKRDSCVNLLYWNSHMDNGTLCYFLRKPFELFLEEPKQKVWLGD